MSNAIEVLRIFQQNKRSVLRRKRANRKRVFWMPNGNNEKRVGINISLNPVIDQLICIVLVFTHKTMNGCGAANNWSNALIGKRFETADNKRHFAHLRRNRLFTELNQNGALFRIQVGGKRCQIAQAAIVG